MSKNNNGRKRDSQNSIKGDALENDRVPAPKMKITAKVLDGNTIEKNESVDKSAKQKIQEKRDSGARKEKRVNIGWVISRLDEPKDVEYDGNVMRVSPRAKMKVADHTKLGDLPNGLVLKK